MAKRKDQSGKVPSGAILTKHLKELALELSDQLGEDGNALTRAAALALVLWKKALGHTVVTDKGDIKKEPESWAMQFIYERLEGRTPMAMTDSKGGTVAERVSDLGKTKVNALTLPPAPPKVG